MQARRKLLGLLLGGVIQVTGYTLGGYAADGTATGPGVAACPSIFPIGTVLDVEGTGVVTCHDRTPGDPWLIDVWVGDVSTARALTCVGACSRRYEVVS